MSLSSSVSAPRWPAAPVFLVGIALFVGGELTHGLDDLSTALILSAVPLSLLAAWTIASRNASRWWPRLAAALDRHDEAVETIEPARLGAWIMLASALGLFIELMLIRWHSSMFQLFALYKNVSLLAAFLGLGLGYARGSMRPLMTPLVMPAIALQFLVLYGLSQTTLHDHLRNPVLEQSAMGFARVHSFGAVLIAYGFLLLVFTLTVVTCLPLGQLAARLMRRELPLVAYSANLLGSLAGILAFTLLGYLWSPPAVWILVAALGLGVVLARGASAWTVAPTIASVAAVAWMLAMPLSVDLSYVYSPYQVLAIETRRDQPVQILANHSYFQHIVDLSAAAQTSDPKKKIAAAYYELPYVVRPDPADVLVVGSGTGNDVAAALRRNARHVDAVEIDPVILDVGRRLHPEDPYNDPRVSPVVEDARSFVRRTDHRYDLVVYGLLDSHAQLSGMTSVRLDSFVYTVEAFREARARLKPGGLLVMTFCLVNWEQGRKMYDMLTQAFDGLEPVVFETGYDFGTSFVIGEGMMLPTGIPLKNITATVKAISAPVAVSTDDWPFLYMARRTYPLTYVVVIALLLLVSVVMIRELLPAGTSRFEPVAFFLGAGFMLVETKSITELGLTLGNTWQVISVVIAGILTMAYLANRIILRRGRMPDPIAYGLLAASLLLGLAISGEVLSGMPPVLSRIVMVAVLTLPMFFSGFAFSSEVAREGDVSSALSSNLFGAMVGGFLEYNSMYFGFRSLYVFALVLYAMAFVFSTRRA
ncbi:MAG TPA: hypothetical protein VN634_12900 [Candidatus Limnocylindrales bacterium]|nr:hypothetical protein [Candidatus Limnocylindrales bacterium]